MFWIIGGFAETVRGSRWWTLALRIEFARTVGSTSGRRGSAARRIADWDVDGGHMAERCALFVIIALGESLLVTGATFARADVERADARRLLQRRARQHR